MTLNADACYRAVQSRDARFDGRFFTGVLSTGIYCRPVCPATTPKRQNVRFFACAAAAEAAGLRPCRRCRPETSPGTPAWLGSSHLVSRALRLIREGFLDERTVPALAQALGLSERQFRRLFQKHLGATPVAVAQTQRVGFAMKLLHETDLPITSIAFCAGFSSVRRFNAAFKRAHGAPPSQWRKRPVSANGTPSTLKLKLGYRPPFDWDGLLTFLAARAIPGVEGVTGRAYQRTVQANETAGVVRVSHLPNERCLSLEVPIALAPDAERLNERVRRLFDLDADPLAVASVLGRDPALGRLLANRPGVRVPGAWDGFELAVRAILGQQVNVRAATTLAGRLVCAYGTRVESTDAEGTRYLFPTPDRLSEAPLDIGLPQRRAEAIRALARAVIEGFVSFSSALSREALVRRLTTLQGIGPWTAEYVAMRALAEPDAFPTGDLALRRALAEGERPLSVGALKARARAWRPWRAYAVLLLWHST